MMSAANADALNAEAELLTKQNGGTPTTAALLLSGAADVMVRQEQELLRLYRMNDQLRSGQDLLRMERDELRRQLDKAEA